MKELTTEEKAKRFDEALAMAREGNIIIPRWFLENVENTLRIQNNINLDKKTGETCQDRNIRESLNGVRKLLNGEELTGMERLEKLSPSLSKEDERIRKGIVKYLEQSQFGEEHYCIDDDIVIGYIAWLEKQGEQKPADKVEPKYVPKFHEGDWIISRLTKNEPRQIAEITEEGYKTTYGGWIGFSFEKDMRLWTIQDAKDGDVICSGQIILLFKKWEDSDWNFVIAYAGIDVSGELQITNGHWLIANDSNPATKEQRDLLFQKMYEAGYEWDAERKELCPLSKSDETHDQVTQQPTLEDTAKTFLQALSDTPYNNTPVVEAQFAVKQLLTFLYDPKAYGPDASNEHKSAAWSEEDEEVFEYLKGLTYSRKETELAQKAITWLKSIKQRYMGLM